jgi:hypothetical protein
MPPPLKAPSDGDREGDRDRERERLKENAQKSEAMAREHSAKREMRIRQDKVRPLEEPPPRPKKPPTTSSSSSALAPLDLGDTPRELPRDPAVTEKLPERPKPLTPPSSRAHETQKQPLPPLDDDADSDKVRRGGNSIDDVATELEELIRDVRAGWRRFESADKITLWAALLTFSGTLMPWLSDGQRPFQIGLVAGGGLHAALAVCAVVLLVRRQQARADQRGVRLSAREAQEQARRMSLWHLLLGALSTFLGMAFLVFYGLQRSVDNGLEIRFGLYFTLAMGMGLSYGGYARFRRRRRSR